jgi:hypothetical protein
LLDNFSSKITAKERACAPGIDDNIKIGNREVELPLKCVNIVVVSLLLCILDFIVSTHLLPFVLKNTF